MVRVETQAMDWEHQSAINQDNACCPVAMTSKAGLRAIVRNSPSVIVILSNILITLSALFLCNLSQYTYFTLHKVFLYLYAASSNIMSDSSE